MTNRAAGCCSVFSVIKQMNRFFLFLSLAGLALMTACSGDKDNSHPGPGPDEGATNRKALLTYTVDDIILPGYAAFKVKLDTLTNRTNAFGAKPDPTKLTSLRQAWADAYVEWQKVELFDVGPANTQTLRFFFNIYPANASGIEDNIKADNPNLDLPSAYPRQGFPALDYLLNGVGATDAAILAKYTKPEDGSVARIAYLKKIVTKMNLMLGLVVSEWGNSRDKFITCTGLDAGCSTSQLVNGYVLHYERYIRSGKIGIPSGAMTNGVVAPEKVEGFYKKDLSKLLAQTAQQAFVDFFNGKSRKTGSEGLSLKTYLDGLKARDSKTGELLTTAILNQLDVAAKKLQPLKASFYDEIQTNNTAVVDVYTEMQKVVRMLKVDMTTAMSITITYTDNDGD